MPGLVEIGGSVLGMQERHWSRYWLGLAIVAGVTGLYAYERDMVGQYLNYQRSRSEFRDMQRQVEESRKEEELARRRVEMLRTDPVEIEAAVRRNKNLLRAGERVYRIEPGINGDSSPLFQGNKGELSPFIQDDDGASMRRTSQNEAPTSGGRD